MLGAHTDSPNLRLKPLADVQRARLPAARGRALRRRAAAHLARPRPLARRPRRAARATARPRTLLVDFGRPLLRVPNLAIHLHREVNAEGLKLNAQTPPRAGRGLEGAPPLRRAARAPSCARRALASVRAERRASASTSPPTTCSPRSLSGARGEFLHASRLDNLASCHAALRALLAACDAGPPPRTRVVVLYDHEEVGSRSAAGRRRHRCSPTRSSASSAAAKGGAPQGLARAVARSLLISADMAHAVHPNYADRHEPGHRPVIGRGPVLKQNAGPVLRQRRAHAPGCSAQLCDEVGVTPQHFVSRSDLACGSTIGPISAARVGIPTVDVGNPMLSMHSCREMAGAADVAPMIEVLARFLGAPRSA